MGGGTKRKTSAYLLGTEPGGATGAEMDAVENEITQIKTAVQNVGTTINTIQAVYSNSGINFQSNGQKITFPDGTEQTTAGATGTIPPYTSTASTNMGFGSRALENSSASNYQTKTIK